MTHLINCVKSSCRLPVQWRVRNSALFTYTPVLVNSGTLQKLSGNIRAFSSVGNLNLEEICKTGNVPVNFNFARDIFDWHATQRPKDSALWFCNERFEDRIWSFSEVQHESIKASLLLQKILELDQTNKGTPASTPFVLAILPRIPEWWFLHMGAIRAGVIFCPGTTLLTAEDIRHRLEASSAQMIITDEENARKVDTAQQMLMKGSNDGYIRNLKKVVIGKNATSSDPLKWINYAQVMGDIHDSHITNFKPSLTKSDEISQAFFTSGTTGKPKMVAHSHSSYGIGHLETVRQIGLQSTDMFWNISDPGWAKSSYSNFFAPWIAGSTVFIHQMKRFEAKPVLEALRKKPVTVLCAPPTLFKSMMPEPPQSFQFKALRQALGAGEPLNPEVIRAWKKKTNNVTITQMYGQTEFTVLGCQHPTEDKEGSIGKPNGMYSVKIVNESGNEMPRNQEGILALQVKPVRPVGLFKGYLKKITDRGPLWDSEKNEQCFVNDVYLTGDKCCMDEDGYIFFIGRADDIINSSGYRIGPTEVESALQTHPAVVESAAVSSPDAERGEVVKAFIVLHEQYKNADPQKLIVEIQQHVKSQTAPYKYPRKVEFVDSLPKTVSGKILRRDLKRREYENWKGL